MKRNLKILIIAAFLVTVPLLMFAQPPHPNGGNNPNPGTNTPVGNAPAAPVGNGTFILLTLALAYAGRKAYVLRSTVAVE
jgi:hypothetical protein